MVSDISSIAGGYSEEEIVAIFEDKKKLVVSETLMIALRTIVEPTVILSSLPYNRYNQLLVCTINYKSQGITASVQSQL